MARPITMAEPELQYKRQENIPSPDPSLATNERLADAEKRIYSSIDVVRKEVRNWVDTLQVLQESNLQGAVKILETRLNGNDTALVAALQAQKEAAQKQTDSFAAILSESKSGSTKQIDGLNEKIDDLKERMSESGGRRSEGKDLLAFDQHRLQNNIAVVAVAIGVMGLLVALAGIVFTATRPAQVVPASAYAQPGGVQHQTFPTSPSWNKSFHKIIWNSPAEL